MSLIVAGNVISIATMLAALALWCFGGYAFVMMPRWLHAFTARTKAIENGVEATTYEMKAHGRALDRTEAAITHVEVVVREQADRVIVAVRDRQLGDAAQSIRGGR